MAACDLFGFKFCRCRHHDLEGWHDAHRDGGQRYRAECGFREGAKIHRYLKTSIQSLAFDSETGASATSTSSASLGAGRRGVTLPAGTEIVVMANQDIDSKTAEQSQVFPADVAENVTNASGQIIIPKGSEAQLVIRHVKAAGL